MSDKEEQQLENESRGGYIPLQEGYQPNETKGYTPNDPQDVIPSPPPGGSGTTDADKKGD